MSTVRRRLTSVTRMGAPEFSWRARIVARAAIDRAGLMAKRPQWDRADLTHALVDGHALAGTRRALAAGRWQDAHTGLSQYLVDQPRRFLVSPGIKAALVQRITAAWPGSARDAADRADRIVTGEYTLLGYQDLTFSSPYDAGIDWHWDPVHRRRMPERFWATVAFLDPALGDHKIVWELNRHQHWIQLTRAFWLTGDERYRQAFLAELASWLRANPPLMGANWASMLELGFRVLSWLWALNGFVSPETRDDLTPWTVDLLLALDRQLTHIERNLSRYFSPNTHLLGEALALYVAGRALPCLAASPRRASIGRDVLVAEIERQITPDGCHRERSAHYHRYTLDFYLLALSIAQLTNDPVAPVFAEVSTRLADTARVLADDRGRLPHFGDDDGGMLLPICGRPVDDIRDSLAIADALLGRAPQDHPPEEALWAGAIPPVVSHESRVPMVGPASRGRTEPVVSRESASGVGSRGSVALRDMGYFVSRSRGGAHVVIHAGPHGYLNGGHAHAAALSLTVSLRGRPFLIDPGTACYTVDAGLRERFRSTAFHNTLVLDGRSQSQPDGPFHWAGTATSAALEWKSGDSFDYFVGTHDGYRPLEHKRHILILHDELLAVVDLIEGRGEHGVATHWHLDPRWAVELSRGHASLAWGSQRVELAVPHGTLEHFAGDEVTGLGWHSPAYGRIEAGSTLRVSHQGTAPIWLAAIFRFSRH